MAKEWVLGFALFAPIGKSGKRMGYGICTFCTKWQKDGLWDLHFLHQVAKVAKIYDLRFLHQVENVVKGWVVGFALLQKVAWLWDLHFCTKWQKWQKDGL